MASSVSRAVDFQTRMSPAEAVMWRLSDDPWLRPVAASLAVLDRPMDSDRFWRRARQLAADVSRLRERVAPGYAPWDPPHWVPDPDFDLQYHVRHVALAGNGSLDELHDLVSRWYEDPFDPGRPMWQFVVVDGLEGERSALFCKIHHAISDGVGLLRLSEAYLDLEPDVPSAPDVDLEGVVAAAAREPRKTAAPSVESALLPSVLQLSQQAVRLAGSPISALWRSAAEAASLLRDPQRARQSTDDLVTALRTAAGELDLNGSSGSPLWNARSGRRHVEAVRVPLDDIKRAGATLGGSVNDVFVTGAVNATVAYHELHKAPLKEVTFSFVVSQRQGDGVGGNYFTPVRVRLPVPPLPASDRLAAVRDAMTARRDAARSGSLSLNSLAGLGQFLPAPVLRSVARSQAAPVDFATSNLRGPPVPVYVGGARVIHNTAMGPLTGTPFNLTTISYDGSMDMGLFVDPVAVADPSGLKGCLQEAFGELIGFAP
jgi:WS/DGAT/MGAT family acyltransferase